MVNRKNMSIEKDYKKLLSIAREAGRITKKYFGKNLKITTKETPADLKTRADCESDKYIVKNIKKQFPEYSIFSEENGSIDNNSDYLFIIDPLDGTNNFVLGIPNFSVSIALTKNNKTIFGVIYNPILDSLYYAEVGKGAFLNDKRIKVNKQNKISQSTVSYTCGYVNSKNYGKKIIGGLDDLGVKRRIENWSPALDFCLLASGKIEAVINNRNDIYDYAAGKLIAKEAGAVVTDFKGKKEDDEQNSQFLASNCRKVHDQLLGIL